MTAITETTTQVLSLVGDLSITELPEVSRRIERVIAQGTRQLVLDLTNATLVSAAALRVFDATERHLADLGGTLSLRNPRPLTLKVLQITGLDRLLEA